MKHDSWIDNLPTELLLGLTVLLLIASIEVGFRAGRNRGSKKEEESTAPTGSVVGATLGLLAFILAFTFGMAASRYEARRTAVTKEANAIGTAYLRTDLLPATHQVDTRELLRKYVQERLKATSSSEHLHPALRRSKSLQDALWKRAALIATEAPPSLNHGLFAQSVNELIDVGGERMAFGLYNRIPDVVWIVLYLVAIVAMLSLGYYAGLAHCRRSMTAVLVTLAFSVVLLLTIVLDRPLASMRLVGHEALEALLDDMKGTDK